MAGGRMNRPCRCADGKQCRHCWLFENDENFRKIWSGTPKAEARPFQLGDAVESALSAVGVTKERVEKWLGGPCGCEERKAMLNRLWTWATGGGSAERIEEMLKDTQGKAE